MSKLSTYSKEYAKIKAKEIAIEVEKQKLNEKVYAELKKSGQTSATFPEGIMTIVPQTEWVYTKTVEKKAEELSELKAKEKENGKAKKIINGESVRFTPKKESK